MTLKYYSLPEAVADALNAEGPMAWACLGCFGKLVGRAILLAFKCADDCEKRRAARKAAAKEAKKSKAKRKKKKGAVAPDDEEEAPLVVEGGYQEEMKVRPLLSHTRPVTFICFHEEKSIFPFKNKNDCARAPCPF